jgi:hypothetical protein
MDAIGVAVAIGMRVAVTVSRPGGGRRGKAERCCAGRKKHIFHEVAFVLSGLNNALRAKKAAGEGIRRPFTRDTPPIRVTG